MTMMTATGDNLLNDIVMYHLDAGLRLKADIDAGVCKIDCLQRHVDNVEGNRPGIIARLTALCSGSFDRSWLKVDLGIAKSLHQVSKHALTNWALERITEGLNWNIFDAVTTGLRDEFMRLSADAQLSIERAAALRDAAATLRSRLPDPVGTEALREEWSILKRLDALYVEAIAEATAAKKALESRGPDCMRKIMPVIVSTYASYDERFRDLITQNIRYDQIRI